MGEGLEMKERLRTMLLLYEGKGAADAAGGIVRRSRGTTGNWIGAWNERGVDGLVPNFTGGPRPRMESDEWDKIVSGTEGKGDDPVGRRGLRRGHQRRPSYVQDRLEGPREMGRGRKNETGPRLYV